MILENSPEVCIMGESLDVSMAREGMPGVNAVCLLNVCGLRTSLCLVSDTSFILIMNYCGQVQYLGWIDITMYIMASLLCIVTWCPWSRDLPLSVLNL